jgi:RNA polymerase sigma-70 factor, ECF subfamily
LNNDIATEEDLEGIIRRSQQHDLQAQELLIKHYQSRVAGFVFSMTGRQECIEDLTQTVFIKMLKALPSLKQIERFQSWLFRIARNTCLDHLRLQRWTQVFIRFTSDHEKIPAASTQQFSEDMGWLARELQDLPPNQREVIVLMQNDALSYQEMADILHCSIESVKSRIFRARAALNERRKKYERSTS